MVKIEVNGIATWALIDSGADKSMISHEFAQTAIAKQDIEYGYTGQMSGAGGHRLDMKGKASVAFRIRTLQFVHTMAVVGGLVYQVILGRDFCCQHATVLDDDAAIFKICGQAIPLPTYEEVRPRRSSVVSATAITVPPRSETIVQVQVNPLDGGYELDAPGHWQGVFEPRRGNGKSSWLMPRVVATVGATNTIPAKVMNTGTEEVIVPANTPLGTLYTIQEDGEGVYDIPSPPPSVQESDVHGNESWIDELQIQEAAVSETGKRALRRLVTEYHDIFSRCDDDIGKTSLVEHTIDTGDAKPIQQRPRRIPLRLRDEVERQKGAMLKEGIIEESTSPWCSPIVLVKKKDGSFRFCIDLRAVNAVTQNVCHPLPRTDDALDSLAGATYFSTLDMASGYWQVCLSREDRPKTAFSTGKGLHQFRAMPFGLKNSGATFQRLMELVLAGVDPQSCLVYLDDIILFGKTELAHLEILEDVFGRIREAGMKLKPRKCRLARDEVIFLGHKVSKEGIQPDPGNLIKVRDWPLPKKPEQLKSFLGLCGYYARFLEHYSDLVKPLREAAEGKGELIWSSEMTESFQKLRALLTSEPVLSLPTLKGTFTLATDASDSAIGSVLTETVDGKEKVIAYASKVLSKTERRWPTYDKELWAVVWSIRHFRQYLVGCPFLVLTDHKPLQNLPRSINVENDATGRRGRWAVELSSYEFSIQYKKGKLHSNADALSRRSTPETGGGEVANCTVMQSQVPPVDKFTCLNDIVQEQESDAVLGVVRSWVTRGQTPSSREIKRTAWKKTTSPTRCSTLTSVNFTCSLC